MARIVLNRSAVRDLLRSQAIQADIGARARRIAAAAGDGFEVDEGVGRNRARASVRTVSHEGRYAEATQRALTRAIDAGR
jgi:hypothetical protein